MVYVIDMNGQPLMPTARHGSVRRKLKNKQAKIVNRCPFTIQLLYEATDYVQDVSVGLDAGTKHIGSSATTEGKELYAAEILPRTDITKLLSQRRESRRTRRNRKTRYRKPRFLNRVKSKHKGWLPPSIEAAIQTHITEAKEICSILPVSKITIEVAQFDTQLLKAVEKGEPLPEGLDYQNGEQSGFWNVREYVFWRDGHTCQCCKGKSKDPVLNVHHIESRQTGGNSPGNIITLCETCHHDYHKGLIELPDSIKRIKPFRDATQMGIMRWELYRRMKETFEPLGIEVKLTYGYLTKQTRIKHGIEKSHTADARCISGNPDATPAEDVFLKKKVRCHNRQIYKQSIQKGGTKKKNQCAKEIHGYRLFDKVKYLGEICFIFGKRASGYFDIRHLDGTKISASISYKKLTLIEHVKYVLIERRGEFLHAL